MMLVLLSITAYAAKKPTINKKKKTVTVGKTIKLNIFNAGGYVKWSSSNSKVAKITKTLGRVNGKARIKGIKKGTATITAKTASGKKLKCKVTVKAKKKPIGGGTVYITNTGSKFHAWGCRFLRQSCIKTTRTEAISHGLEPCGVCNP